MDPLTQEQFKNALPEKFRGKVNKDLMTQVNSTLSDPAMHEHFRDNLISYTTVLKEGKFRIEQYVNAVKYASYRLMGKTKQEAYSLTFPVRAQQMAAAGTSSKDVASYVAIYDKSKLVNLIMEQTLIPSWILNQDIYQKAINCQAELMVKANSEKVRSDAANSILTHLKRPETHKVELSVGAKEDDSIKELRTATLELVKQQRLMIQSGQSDAEDVAQSSLIIEGQAERVE
jgi:hypothetical protein